MVISLNENGKRLKEKIKDEKILVAGVLIGIIGSLIAGVINDLIRNSSFYPYSYLITLTIILLIIVYVSLREYFKWRWFLFKCNKLLNKRQKMIV